MSVAESLADHPPVLAQVQFGFRAVRDDELPLEVGELVDVLFKEKPDGWWYGRSKGAEGYFPGLYVQELHAVVDSRPKRSSTRYIAANSASKRSSTASGDVALAGSAVSSTISLSGPSQPSAISAFASSIGMTAARMVQSSAAMIAAAAIAPAIAPAVGASSTSQSSESLPPTLASESTSASGTEAPPTAPTALPAPSQPQPQKGMKMSSSGTLGPPSFMVRRSTSTSDSGAVDGSSEEDPWFIPVEQIEFLHAIGRGAFGSVYKGIWNGTEIAIKYVIPPSDSDEDALYAQEVCRKEAAFLRSFQHKNIIEFKGACLNFIVMEYAEAGSLYNHLRKLKTNNTAIPPKLLVQWSLDIAEGMRHMGEMSPPVLHRDLKSQNILIGKDNTLKISDFGVARHVRSMNASNRSAVGTFAWLAPETIREHHYSAKSDVWSYGVILWEMLTNEQPYRDMEPAAIAYGVATLKLTLPIPHNCPENFKGLLKSTWMPDPAERPMFADICVQLKQLQESPFYATPEDSFINMQQSWKPQIDRAFGDLQKMETTLKEREEERLRQERVTQQNHEDSSALLNIITRELTQEEKLRRQEEDVRRTAEEFRLREAILEISNGHNNAPSTIRKSKREKTPTQIDFSISKPFNFRHLSHVGTKGHQFDVRKLEPLWRTIIEQAGITYTDLCDQDTLDFLMHFACNHGEPYQQISHKLVNVNTGRDSFSEITHQSLYDELHRSLVRDLRASWTLRTQTPHRRPINLTTSFKLIVTPLKTTTEQRICVMWMGHQNPQQRDWIGLVPKGQRNRFAVGHTFLNGHVFGMATFYMTTKGSFEVRMIDSEGKTLLGGETVEVTLRNRKRSVSDAPMMGSLSQSTSPSLETIKSSTLSKLSLTAVRSSTSELDLRSVTPDTDSNGHVVTDPSGKPRTLPAASGRGSPTPSVSIFSRLFRSNSLKKGSTSTSQTSPTK